MKHRKLTIYYAIEDEAYGPLVSARALAELGNLFEEIPGHVEMHTDVDNGSGTPRSKY